MANQDSARTQRSDRFPDEGVLEHGDPSDSADDPELVSLAENHGFASARCACGWVGPGRRSRRRARADAEEHLAEAHAL
jgi:hypothetical protein